jgi:serine O-acetyltransferase
MITCSRCYRKSGPCSAPALARDVIDQDVNRWVELRQWRRCRDLPPWRKFTWLVRLCPEFRNLFHHRVRHAGPVGLLTVLLTAVAASLYRPLDSLYIHTALVGPGLYIQHGFSTIISARSIGANCWIYQQVTIGYTDTDKCPIIGDNVMVTAGA